MAKNSKLHLTSSEINTAIDNLLFCVNPRSTFKELLIRIESMSGDEKAKAIEAIYRRVRHDINLLSDLKSMSNIYFGKLERTLELNWLVPSKSTDKAVQRRFMMLEKAFKSKVQLLIDKEVGELSQEAMSHGEFCGYERYIFTRGYTSRFGFRCVTDANDRYKESIEALLRFYGLKVVRAKDSDELHEVITSLQAINYANVLKTPDETKRGRLVFVHVFDNFLEDLINNKYSEFFIEECSSCESTEKKLGLLDKYPIIKNFADSLYEKCEKILGR